MQSTRAEWATLTRQASPTEPDDMPRTSGRSPTSTTEELMVLTTIFVVMVIVAMAVYIRRGRRA